MVRKQYNFWPGEHGLDAWDVDRLIQLSRDLPVRDLPLDAITEIDSDYWFSYGPIVPTVRRVVEHMRLTNEADPSVPIILAANGRVMDGMHRVARAILDGSSTISAVRFDTDPDPDYRNCSPGDLPYWPVPPTRRSGVPSRCQRSAVPRGQVWEHDWVPRLQPRINTVKTLFALSGNTCALPDCEVTLTDPSWSSVRAEMAHIRGGMPGSARYDAAMTPEARRDFDNLILLCPNCHALIDDLNPQAYPVDRLNEIKARHESRAETGSLWVDEVRLDCIAEQAIAGYAAEGETAPPPEDQEPESQVSIVQNCDGSIAVANHGQRKVERVRISILNGTNRLLRLPEIQGFPIKANQEMIVAHEVSEAEFGRAIVAEEVGVAVVWQDHDGTEHSEMCRSLFHAHGLRRLLLHIRCYGLPAPGPWYVDLAA
jgi:hypothetical protein